MNARGAPRRAASAAGADQGEGQLTRHRPPPPCRGRRSARKAPAGTSPATRPSRSTISRSLTREQLVEVFGDQQHRGAARRAPARTARAPPRRCACRDRASDRARRSASARAPTRASTRRAAGCRRKAPQRGHRATAAASRSRAALAACRRRVAASRAQARWIAPAAAEHEILAHRQARDERQRQRVVGNAGDAFLADARDGPVASRPRPTDACLPRLGRRRPRTTSASSR